MQSCTLPSTEYRSKSCWKVYNSILNEMYILNLSIGVAMRCGPRFNGRKEAIDAIMNKVGCVSTARTPRGWLYSSSIPCLLPSTIFTLQERHYSNLRRKLTQMEISMNHCQRIVRKADRKEAIALIRMLVFPLLSKMARTNSGTWGNWAELRHNTLLARAPSDYHFITFDGLGSEPTLSCGGNWALKVEKSEEG